MYEWILSCIGVFLLIYIISDFLPYISRNQTKVPSYTYMKKVSKEDDEDSLYTSKLYDGQIVNIKQPIYNRIDEHDLFIGAYGFITNLDKFNSRFSDYTHNLYYLSLKNAYPLLNVYFNNNQVLITIRRLTKEYINSKQFIALMCNKPTSIEIQYLDDVNILLHGYKENNPNFKNYGYYSSHNDSFWQTI